MVHSKKLHIFIGGPPGSGKTTLCKYFQEQGKNAYDGDKTVGFFRDKMGKKIKLPPRIGKRVNKWAEKLGLEWTPDMERLKKLINDNRNKEMYLFGGPVPEHMERWFGKRFWLYEDEKLALKRVKRRLNDKNAYHRFGETKEQKDKIVKMVKEDNIWAKKEGYKFIDADMTPIQIFEIITNNKIKKDLKRK
ncbi:MAG: AAA family ATPase [Candidatus Micrarchaeia archaeon]